MFLVFESPWTTEDALQSLAVRTRLCISGLLVNSLGSWVTELQC